MYWEKCHVSLFDIGERTFVKLSGTDAVTNEPYWVYLSNEMYSSLKNGGNFIQVLHGVDFATKNFLATGQGATTNSFFQFERKIKKKVFITNAVAHSVAYYAWVYINHHYKVAKNFWFAKDVEEIKEEFLKQSKEFLEMYKDIINHIDEILPRFTEDELLRYFKSSDKMIVKHYIRRVYHTHLECDFMRSDYSETDSHHLNTGVFFENNLLKGTHVYCLDEEYLKELGMRECKGCQKLSFKEPTC